MKDNSIEFENYLGFDFLTISPSEDVIPSKFYFISATGDRVYIKARSYERAKDLIAGLFGKVQYAVRTIGGVGGSDNISVRATQSRRGFTYKLKDNQIPRGLK